MKKTTKTTEFSYGKQNRENDDDDDAVHKRYVVKAHIV